MNDLKNILQPVLALGADSPVLVDVGASGRPPEIWQPIASRATYVGFDPDLREIRREARAGYAQSIMINQAVTPWEDQEQVTFHLTRSPFCSSTLEPDHQALSAYHFWPMFQVQNTCSTKATTLTKVMAQLQLAQIDWLKVDTQGTDLRILRSLPDALRCRLLAIDIEPGLINAYVGEDMFTQTHESLVHQGFFLSNMQVKGSIRISRSAAETLQKFDASVTADFLDRTNRSSPGWCEARYLRTVAWLAQQGLSRRQWVWLWAFACLDAQWAYAAEVGVEFSRRFLRDPAGQLMIQGPLGLMRQRDRDMQRQNARQVPARLARRVAGKISSYYTRALSRQPQRKAA